jgi:hypothetical protein
MILLGNAVEWWQGAMKLVLRGVRGVDQSGQNFRKIKIATRTG